MKKAAGIILLIVGVTLLSLNYVSTSFQSESNNSLFFSNSNASNSSELIEEPVEITGSRLPSIFTAIIGLLK